MKFLVEYYASRCGFVFCTLFVLSAATHHQLMLVAVGDFESS